MLVPRVRKIDSPPLSAKFDVPNMVLPQRSRTVASRPGHKLTPELTQHLNDTPPTGTGSQVRLKPEVPKGKKPVLKTKPALEGAQNRRYVLAFIPAQRLFSSKYSSPVVPNFQPDPNSILWTVDSLSLISRNTHFETRWTPKGSIAPSPCSRLS